MQVERGRFYLPSGGRVSNAWVTYLEEADNLGKPRLIRHVVMACGS